MEAEDTKKWEVVQHLIHGSKNIKDGGKGKKNERMTKWIEEEED